MLCSVNLGDDTPSPYDSDMSFRKVRLIVCSLASQWMDYRVVAKHRSCSILFLVTSYSILLDTSSSTLWRCSSNSVLLLNSVIQLFNLFLILRVQFRRKSVQLHQRVCSTPSASLLNSISGSFHFCILTVWKVPPVSGSFPSTYSMKSSVIYSALCSRT